MCSWGYWVHLVILPFFNQAREKKNTNGKKNAGRKLLEDARPELVISIVDSKNLNSIYSLSVWGFSIIFQNVNNIYENIYKNMVDLTKK